MLSPWQQDLHARLLPMSLSRQQNADKLLAVMFPSKSSHSDKIPVYMYYIQCYYKHKLSTMNKKDIRQFCKLIHRIGHKFIPAPGSTIPASQTGSGFPMHENLSDQNEDMEIMTAVEKQQVSNTLSFVFF